MTITTRLARRFVAGALIVGSCIGMTRVPAGALPAVSDLEVESVDVAGHPQIQAILVPPKELGDDALRRSTLTILEGSVKRSATLESLPSNHLAVELVLDTSQSMDGPAIVAAKRAAVSFVSAMPADTQIAVVDFGTTAMVRSPFTTDRTKTTAALESLQVRGETALHDAVITGTELFNAAKLPSGTRRVMVLLSDGGDTASKASLAGASQAVQAAGVSVSAISLATAESDAVSLQALTTSTAGGTASAVDPAALRGVFDAIANSVVRRYRVVWESESSGSSDVSFMLEADSRTWQTVRTLAYPTPSPTGRPTTAAPPLTVTTVVAPPQPQIRVVPADSGEKWLYTGLASGFLSVLLAAGMAFWPGRPKRRLAAEYGTPSRNEVSGITQGVIRATGDLLRRHERGTWLSSTLERAGMTTDAPTAAVVGAGVGLCGLVFGFIVHGIALALLFGVSGITLCALLLKARADKRSLQFRDQFEACLQIIINSLRSGYGASQAIATVAQEAEAPASEEFRRIVAETTLGRDQVHALAACAKRNRCDELQWVAESMEVNREVGGNLAEMLTEVAATIRSRVRLGRQVNAVSAEGRVSAKILLVMPLVAIGIQAVFNRKGLGLLFHGGGLVLLIGSAASMTVGYIWTKRIIRITY